MGEYKIIAERASEEDIKRHEELSETRSEPSTEYVEDGIKYKVEGKISVLDSDMKTVDAYWQDARITDLIDYTAKIINDERLAIGKLEITVKEDPNLLSQRAKQFKRM